MALPVIPLHVGGMLRSNAHVELIVFFLIGLFGGAHCIGMCGPLVTAYANEFSSDDAAPTWYELRQHTLFNVGRTMSYASIGGAFGVLGASLYSVAGVVLTAAVWLRVAMGLLVGGFVVATAFSYLTGGQGLLGHVTTPLDRVFGVLTHRISGWAGSERIIGLGLLHGLLPCPLIYPAFLYAFARGSPVTGVLSLAALGIGTIPAVFLYGTLIGSVDVKTRIRLHRVLGVVFLAMGWMLIAHGLALLGVPVPHIEPPFYQPLTP